MNAASKATLGCTATGAVDLYFPPGAERDHVIGLLRLAQKFQQQHVGKKPGVLAKLVFDCAKRAGPPFSFNQVLLELNYLAALREADGERASPIEKVDRSWQLLTIHSPRKGRVQVPFATLRNHLTAAKKRLREEIPGSR